MFRYTDVWIWRHIADKLISTSRYPYIDTILWSVLLKVLRTCFVNRRRMPIAVSFICPLKCVGVRIQGFANICPNDSFEFNPNSINFPTIFETSNTKCRRSEVKQFHWKTKSTNWEGKKVIRYDRLSFKWRHNHKRYVRNDYRKTITYALV